MKKWTYILAAALAMGLMAARFRNARAEASGGMPATSPSPATQHQLVPNIQRLELEKSIHSTQNEIDQLVVRRIAAVQKLKDARRETARLDLTPESVPAEIKFLEEQKRAWGLDLAGKQARQKAIGEAIAKAQNEAKAQLSEDAIAGELEKIVAFRQQQAARIKLLREKGLVSTEDMNSAEAAVSEAKIQLLQRRETVSHSLGADTLSKLNGELLTLSIDTAELTARLRAVATRLDELRDFQTRFAELQLQESLDQISQKIDQLRADLKGQKAGLDQMPSMLQEAP